MNGIERQAPELRVQNGLAKMGKYRAVQTVRYRARRNLVAFQHWCQGLPFAWVSDATKVACSVELKDVGFAVIQTVFEGRMRIPSRSCVNQLKYELPVVSGATSNRPARRFQPSWKTTARGTPWFTVIDAGGSIVSRTSISTRSDW